METSPSKGAHLKRLSLSCNEPAFTPSRSIPSTPREDLRALKRRSLQADWATNTPQASPSKLPARSPHKASLGYSKPFNPLSISTASSTSNCNAPPLSASLPEQSDSDSNLTTDMPEMDPRATLLDQHSDLLSLIAKKERRCLDLREELKRQEDELEVLKSRWQSVIVKGQIASPLSLAQSPPTSSTAKFFPSNLLDSPKYTSRPLTHPIPDTTIDVASAKRYMYGVNSWVKSSVAGLLDNIALPSPTSTPVSTIEQNLGTVREELDEEDSSTQSETDSRRTSNSSTIASSVTSIDPDELTKGLLMSHDNTMQHYSLSAPDETPNAGKRKKEAWPNMTDSWTLTMNSLQSSKKAMLSLVDTFEKTLQDAVMLPSPPVADPIASPPHRTRQYSAAGSAHSRHASNKALQAVTNVGSKSRTRPQGTDPLDVSSAPHARPPIQVHAKHHSISSIPLK